MAPRERAGIKRIAREIKDVDRGCSGNIYTIDVCIYSSIYVCARCIGIIARNPKRRTGRRRIFIQRASLEIRDQIRSTDNVRSKYTYFSSRAFLLFRSFSMLLFHFTAGSKYREIMLRRKAL